MSDDISAMVKERIRDWFSREGIKIDSISDPRAEFVFKVKFQRFIFTVVRPNDRNYVQIESQIIISQQHLQRLTSEKMQEFQIRAMQFGWGQDISMGFIRPQPGKPGPQPPGPGFVVSDRIYDDSYSDDKLWRALRRLHSSVDMSISVLNEITGYVGGREEPPTDTGPSYYT